MTQKCTQEQSPRPNQAGWLKNQDTSPTGRSPRGERGRWSSTRRIGASIVALSFASLGLVTSPVQAAGAQCQGFTVDVKGSADDELFSVYSNRIVIDNLSDPTVKNTTVWITPMAQPRVVISTGKGEDKISSHGNIDLIACLYGVEDGDQSEVAKEWGRASVVFSGNGKFTALGGANTVHIKGDGLVETGSSIDTIVIDGNGFVESGGGNDTINVYGISDVSAGPGEDRVVAWSSGVVRGGADDDLVILHAGGFATGDAGDDHLFAWGHAVLDGGSGADFLEIEGLGHIDGGDGDDYILIHVSGSANGGDGDDDITIWGPGTVNGGDGDDDIRVAGRAVVDGGPGNDIINASGSSDRIISGPGIDVVNAGGGKDKCDWTYKTRPGKGDTYSSCETIYGQ